MLRRKSNIEEIIVGNAEEKILWTSSGVSWKPHQNFSDLYDFAQCPIPTDRKTKKPQIEKLVELVDKLIQSPLKF